MLLSSFYQGEVPEEANIWAKQDQGPGSPSPQLCVQHCILPLPTRPPWPPRLSLFAPSVQQSSPQAPWDLLAPVLALLAAFSLFFL